MKPIATKMLLCALAVTVLFSCRKDKLPSTEKPVTKNAKQITFSATDFTTYEYNAAKAIPGQQQCGRCANSSGNQLLSFCICTA